jgi:1,4-dihydroxy-2-naphthoate octaprenyltransferase
MSTKLSKLKIWWQASRYHFIPPSIFPVCIGALVSWAENNILSLWYLFLVLIAVVVNHMALNMTDDYFDYKHSVDNLKPGEKNPYTGGSGTLTSGLIQPKVMFKVFMILYFVPICIGIYFIIERGLIILLFGLIGIFSSIFYTSPPIKFSHHGFGELGLLLNFGIVLGLGSYFVQIQSVTIEAFFATIPCGIMLFSMIIINEIPDIEDDKRAGKLTLIARYGNKFGIKVYIISWICTYLLILIGIIFRYLPIFMIITYCTIPLTYRSITILKKHNQNTIKMVPANLDMIRSHSLTCGLIIIAYFIQGYINGSNLTIFLLFVIIFALFYFPAGVIIFKKPK